MDRLRNRPVILVDDVQEGKRGGEDLYIIFPTHVYSLPYPWTFPLHWLICTTGYQPCLQVTSCGRGLPRLLLIGDEISEIDTESTLMSDLQQWVSITLPTINQILALVCKYISFSSSDSNGLEVKLRNIDKVMWGHRFFSKRTAFGFTKEKAFFWCCHFATSQKYFIQ